MTLFDFVHFLVVPFSNVKPRNRSPQHNRKNGKEENEFSWNAKHRLRFLSCCRCSRLMVRQLLSLNHTYLPSSAHFGSKRNEVYSIFRQPVSSRVRVTQCCCSTVDRCELKAFVRNLHNECDCCGYRVFFWRKYSYIVLQLSTLGERNMN